MLNLDKGSMTHNKVLFVHWKKWLSRASYFSCPDLWLYVGHDVMYYANCYVFQ